MRGGKSHKKSQKGRTRQFSSIEEMRRDMRNNFDPDDGEAPKTENAGIKGAIQLFQNATNAEYSETDTDTDEEQETRVVVKKKGVGDLIKICNPNRMTGNYVDLTDHPESLGRRDKRESKADVERMRADLARLAIVRQQREEVAAKREAAAAEREAAAAAKREAATAKRESQKGKKYAFKNKRTN